MSHLGLLKQIKRALDPNSLLIVLDYAIDLEAERDRLKSQLAKIEEAIKFHRRKKWFEKMKDDIKQTPEDYAHLLWHWIVELNATCAYNGHYLWGRGKDYLCYLGPRHNSTSFFRTPLHFKQSVPQDVLQEVVEHRETCIGLGRT